MTFREKLGVIRGNMLRADRRQCGNAEIKLSHLIELSDAIASEYAALRAENASARADSFDELRALYAEACAPEPPESALLPDNPNQKLLADYFERHGVLERVFICRRLADSCGPFLSLSEDGDSPDRISYLRNSFADAAYARFAKVLASPSVTYCRDFTGVCEDVYYGRAKYCILPIENTSDGTLTSFRRLIAKYELKIALTCTVECSGYNTARFALLKKNLGRTPVPDKDSAGRYLDFTVTLREGDGFSLSDLLCAASICNMKLNKIDSVPTDYSDNYSYELQLSDSGNLPAFLCILTLEAPRYTPVGIYTHLN